MKTKTKSKSKSKSKSTSKSKAKAKAPARAKPKAKKPVPKKRQPAAKPKPKSKAKPKAKPAPRKQPAASRKGSARQVRAATGSKWLEFVRTHGVVLASARGPVPSLASEVAGEEIVGSWWSHPRAQVIFETLSAIDDDVDIRCFKLVDGKVTFVHRRVWPALVRLARDGMLAPDRVASFQQEHLPTGEHRNLVTPFPEWVPEEVSRAADMMTAEQARSALGSWV